jgi:hypothetical protein
LRKLEVSKRSFDMAWIMAIEDSGRHDWYEPCADGCTPRASLPAIHEDAAQKRYRDGGFR